MKKIGIIVCRLVLGFIFCACATVMALKSNLGLSPWDVFHQGLSNITGLTIGQVSIIVGLVVVLITVLLKLEIGIGTIVNMILIGFFIDLINYLNIIPESTNLISGILMLITSLFTMAIGSYLYIGCELGCGPRDGLMVAIVRITGKSVGVIRFYIELGALVIGWILGGTVGIGTLITVAFLGSVIQLVFKIFKLNVNELKHKKIKESFVFLFNNTNSKNSNGSKIG